MRSVLVTGYVPILGHPRSAKEYGELGQELFPKLDCNVGGGFTIHPFYEKVDQTWLYKLVSSLGRNVTHSEGDNPEKNSLVYHFVQHQKFAWLVQAMILHPEAKTYVWMDYGIGHVRGVTARVVTEFMAHVISNDFAVPGCLPRDNAMVNDNWPCWRFCGGLMVVPRNKVYQLYKGVKAEVQKQLAATGNISWEVNNLARAEPNLPPIRWYAADHDSSMFENYGDGLCPTRFLSPESAAPSDAMSMLT